MRRWVGRIALVLLVVLLVALVAGTGFAVITVRSSFPQTSGEVAVPGLSAPVEVRRDEWGIPNITADTAEDLFRAQGYVAAQDRFWEMDFRRHVTSGRLSELFGDSQLGTDRFIRTMGWRRVAEQELDLLDDETLGYLEAYADGVNAYLADRSGSSLSLEYAVLGLQVSGYEPELWTPADSVAWLKAMAWNLAGGLSEEVQRVVWSLYLSEEQLADVDVPYPFDRAPVIVTELADAAAAGADASTASAGRTDAQAAVSSLSGLAAMSERVRSMLGGGAAGSGIGSNSFAISGARTASGMPILANDPHLAPSMPGIWTQVGLHCRTVNDACPFDVSGFSFSGFPGVVLGHNQRIAWGFTNLAADVQDLYLEDVQGDQVRVGSRMEDLEIRTETIQVAGGDPVTIRIRSTSHGPLLSDADDWYRWVGGVAPVADDDATTAPDVALQWTALQPGRTAQAVFLIDRATDFDHFREAARRFDGPSQNMLYADVDGHIGYQAPGLIPVRRTGDGKWPAPGWDTAYGWDGFVPFEDMPWMFDPEDGYIVTANNAVVAEDYPVFLTDDWTFGDRASRIVELIEDAADPFTVESAAALAFDQQSPVADVLAPYLAFLPHRATYTDGTRAMLEGLPDWDGQQTPDSTEAAFLNAVWSHLVARTFNDELVHADYHADGGDRWLEIMRGILEEPSNAWWDDQGTAGEVEYRDDILDLAVSDAVSDLSERLGDDSSEWTWGALHTFMAVNDTFGKSGIGPIEWLFNRGPWEVGGGRDTVDATGWDARVGYEVDWVPSMRMVVDLANLDASRYVNLTGASGHAFHEHYDDQVPLWAEGRNTAWPFSPDALESATVDLLTLQPE